MISVQVSSVFDSDDRKSRSTIYEGKCSAEKTVGQTLYVLIVQMEEVEVSRRLIVYEMTPDVFFTAEQQKRLSALMELWRQVRDQGKDLPSAQQAELESLVEAELNASTFRTKAQCSKGPY